MKELYIDMNYLKKKRLSVKEVVKTGSNCETSDDSEQMLFGLLASQE